MDDVRLLELGLVVLAASFVASLVAIGLSVRVRGRDPRRGLTIWWVATLSAAGLGLVIGAVILVGAAIASGLLGLFLPLVDQRPDAGPRTLGELTRAGMRAVAPLAAAPAVVAALVATVARRAGNGRAAAATGSVGSGGPAGPRSAVTDRAGAPDDESEEDAT